MFHKNLKMLWRGREGSERRPDFIQRCVCEGGRKKRWMIVTGDEGEGEERRDEPDGM